MTAEQLYESLLVATQADKTNALATSVIQSREYRVRSRASMVGPSRLPGGLVREAMDWFTRTRKTCRPLCKRINYA